jgi:hypothetical protein
VPSQVDNTTTNANATALTSLLLATDGFINPILLMSVDNGVDVSDDLSLALTFGSFDMAGPEDGEMEFKAAAARLEGIFLTSV